MSTGDAMRRPFADDEAQRTTRPEADQVLPETAGLRGGSLKVKNGAAEPPGTSPETQLAILGQERVALLEKLAGLEKRVADLGEENQDLGTKYVRISQQNESLANLYVASYQLHSTLDPQEVLGIVKEILINLVGAEEFAVFLVDGATHELMPVTGEGTLPRLASGELKWNEEILEQVVRTGSAFYLDEQNPLPGGPLACVPLKIKEEVTGAIAIFKLLVQKEGFTLMDSEILQLLAGHAATAIVASRLYAEAERKLKTIEGVMELLIHPAAPAKPPEAETAA